MKKILSLILVILMVILVLAGCQTTTSIDSVEDLKTFGDILSLDQNECQIAIYENKAIIAFKINGEYYRAISNISQETQDAIFDLDIFDDDYDEKYDNLLKPLKIDKIENLEGMKLSQSEMNSWVGKTGQELLDAGWNESGWNLSDMEFWMDYGPFEYTVTFNGEVSESEYDDFDFYERAESLIVKSVEYNSIGDATDIEIE